MIKTLRNTLIASTALAAMALSMNAAAAAYSPMSSDYYCPPPSSIHYAEGGCMANPSSDYAGVSGNCEAQPTEFNGATVDGSHITCIYTTSNEQVAELRTTSDFYPTLSDNWQSGSCAGSGTDVKLCPMEK